MAIQNVKCVLANIGNAYFYATDGNVYPFSTLSEMVVELQTEDQDVEGGQSLLPIYNFITKKSASYNFTDATFEITSLKLSQGAAIKETGGECFKIEVITPTSGTATLSVTSNVVPAECKAFYAASREPLKLVTGAPSAAGGEIKIDANGVVTTGTADDGVDIEVHIVYTSTNAAQADITTVSIAKFGELRYTTEPFEDPEDGNTYIAHVRVFKARCNGSLTIDQGKGKAFAPKLTFKAVDPRRVDKRFASVSLEKITV